MQITKECYATGIGSYHHFRTNIGMVGMLEISTSERTKLSNAIFRIGYTVDGSVKYAGQRVITELGEKEVCSLINLFDETFSKMKDRSAERKIVEIVYFSDITSTMNILESQETTEEIVSRTSGKKGKSEIALPEAQEEIEKQKKADKIIKRLTKQIELEQKKKK